MLSPDNPQNLPESAWEKLLDIFRNETSVPSGDTAAREARIKRNEGFLREAAETDKQSNQK